MKKDSLKSVIVLTVICLVVALLLSSVNLITGMVWDKEENNGGNREI